MGLSSINGSFYHSYGRRLSIGPAREPTGSACSVSAKRVSTNDELLEAPANSLRNNFKDIRLYTAARLSKKRRAARAAPLLLRVGPSTKPTRTTTGLIVSPAQG
jgi:hypothetical protein